MILNGIIAVVAFFAGVVLSSILYERANKAEEQRLQNELHKSSVYYLKAVETMEGEIDAKNAELQMKQRVMDSLNEEVVRLRRINAKLRRKEACDD